jgi:ubiquinone/menaquinone biosynthesis C-methylase UbiE
MTEIRTPVDFYRRHPISGEIILKKLKARRGNLDRLQPPELFDLDQDHYGGLPVNDALADLAGMRRGLDVVDFCAGLGGPARYFAYKYGVTVTGIDLTAERVQSARELTRLVGLEDKVKVIHGNVEEVPLPDASADIVISQEAFLHLPRRDRAIAEAFRILRPGGRLAFTDWVAHRALDAKERKLLWDGIAVEALESLESYHKLLTSAGFQVRAIIDLTAEWAVILRERLRMFIDLRRAAEAAGTPSGHDAFYEAYVLFVRLIEERALGGGRFMAIKPA